LITNLCNIQNPWYVESDSWIVIDNS
jgi:hypothetical protein